MALRLGRKGPSCLFGHDLAGEGAEDEEEIAEELE